METINIPLYQKILNNTVLNSLPDTGMHCNNLVQLLTHNHDKAIILYKKRQAGGASLLEPNYLCPVSQ